MRALGRGPRIRESALGESPSIQQWPRGTTRSLSKPVDVRTRTYSPSKCRSLVKRTRLRSDGDRTTTTSFRPHAGDRPANPRSTSTCGYPCVLRLVRETYPILAVPLHGDDLVVDRDAHHRHEHQRPREPPERRPERRPSRRSHQNKTLLRSSCPSLAS
mmetsp:Transcript_12616/g.41366  ORF Transcript_12616/g.41366 Transcript_12616/m.41366 type:complete len:159 (+) Transcript_12616:167-643(+)